MGQASASQEQGTTLSLAELLRLLASFGTVELEDVTIRAKKVVIKPLGRREK